jgi:hypothetical protein
VRGRAFFFFASECGVWSAGTMGLGGYSDSSALVCGWYMCFYFFFFWCSVRPFLHGDVSSCCFPLSHPRETREDLSWTKQAQANKIKVPISQVKSSVPFVCKFLCFMLLLDTRFLLFALFFLVALHDFLHTRARVSCTRLARYMRSSNLTFLAGQRHGVKKK